MRQWAGLFILWVAFIYSSEFESLEKFTPSSPEILATLYSPLNKEEYGPVHPLSGQPFFKTIDFRAKGALDLCIERIYIPGFIPAVSFPDPELKQKQIIENLGKFQRGWTILPHLLVKIDFKKHVVYIPDTKGALLEFSYSSYFEGKLTLTSPSFGLCNVLEEVPSGKNNPRNIQAQLLASGSKVQVIYPDGTLCYYESTPSLRSYLFLQKEVLPSGRVIRYSYRPCSVKNGLSWQELSKIESLDPQETFTYACIEVEGCPHSGQYTFKTQNQVSTTYVFERMRMSGKSKQGKKNSVSYSTVSDPFLVKVSSPFYQDETLFYDSDLCLKNYEGKQESLTFNQSPIWHPDASFPHFRTREYAYPSEPPTLISYDPPLAGRKEGVTVFKHPNQTSTEYHFSKELLIDRIVYKDENNQIKKQKNYRWDENHFLKALEITDGTATLYKKTYEYDPFGNPLLETLQGNLSGTSSDETYSIKRRFSQDGKNLLLEEEKENISTIFYRYLKDTNLLSSKITKTVDGFSIREFFYYDESHNLIRKTIDDGTSNEANSLEGVSQQLITLYHLRKEKPFLHMVEEVVESYRDQNEEKCLKKTLFTYDKYGNVSLEQIQDGSYKLLYELRREYNERGDLISETNAEGYTQSFAYDAKGHLEKSTSFSQKLTTYNSWDAKGQLIRQEEVDKEGSSHITTYEYDVDHLLKSRQDYLGNITYYQNDPLTKKVLTTTHPKVVNSKGHPQEVTMVSTYDALGRETSKTDGRGYTTYFCYNLYGNPTQITYPDGTVETFRYTKEGKLASHTDKEGLCISYLYDGLGRVISKNYATQKEGSIAQETFVYNAFHLLQETDKEGYTTYYTYDASSFKTQERREERVKQFSYDSLGRLKQICCSDEDKPLFLNWEYNPSSQIILETKKTEAETPLTETLYGYDGDGNRIYISSDKINYETFTYDGFKRLIEHKDTLGFTTSVTYDETAQDALGQRVLCTLTKKPGGIQERVTQDALGHKVKEEIFNSGADLISSKEFFYDASSNLIQEKVKFLEEGKTSHIQLTNYSINKVNLVERISQHTGIAKARVTHFTYTPGGKLASKQLPNQVTLTYGYDPLGNRAFIHSSDGKIHYQYKYNLNGHLILATDLGQDLIIERKIDPFGNILEEYLGNDRKISKSYDDFDRMVALQIGSEVEIEYVYDPLYLRSILRKSGSKTLYTHTYTQYDPSGHLLAESLIYDLGTSTHHFDKKGQQEAVISRYFTQECAYDPNGKILSSKINGNPNPSTYDKLEPLSFEQISDFSSDTGISYDYDLNGNLISKETPDSTFSFSYDAMNRLTEVRAENALMLFTYDPLDRRIGKKVYKLIDGGWTLTKQESYLYDNDQEIAALLPSGRIHQLKVPGLIYPNGNTQTVAVELDGKPYACISDIQHNIRCIIDPTSKMVFERYEYSSLGELINPQEKELFLNPWRYASKRLDPESGLIYFGLNWYDPQMGRWLNTLSTTNSLPQLME